MVRMAFIMALVLSVVVPTQAGIIISEVHPGGSGNGTYAADWIELTNTGPAAEIITGWKMDDSSASAATAAPMSGVVSIAPGQSAVFAESSGSNPCATITTNFIQAWFGGSAPSGFTMGCYQGSGVGLSTGGDGVVIFDSLNAVVAGVTFGASSSGITFDNAAGIGSSAPAYPAISTLSAVGVNGAFQSSDTAEVGSPGVVPEPSAVLLLCLGSLLALHRCRR